MSDRDMIDYNMIRSEEMYGVTRSILRTFKLSEEAIDLYIIFSQKFDKHANVNEITIETPFSKSITRTLLEELVEKDVAEKLWEGQYALFGMKKLVETCEKLEKKSKKTRKTDFSKKYESVPNSKKFEPVPKREDSIDKIIERMKRGIGLKEAESEKIKKYLSILSVLSKSTYGLKYRQIKTWIDFNPRDHLAKLKSLGLIKFDGIRYNMTREGNNIVKVYR
jgi:hypothetical protein